MALDWDATLRQLTGGGDAYRVARGVIQMESHGNPGQTNTTGNVAGTDYGLFQLNDAIGQGVGYSAADLFNPLKNISIGLPPVLASVRRGQAQGLSGFDLFNYVIGDRGAGHAALADQSEANKVNAWNLTGGGVGVPPKPGSPGTVALPGLSPLPALAGMGAGGSAAGGTGAWAVLDAGKSAGPGEVIPTPAGSTDPAGTSGAAVSLSDALGWLLSGTVPPAVRGLEYTAAGLAAGLLALVLGVVLLGASFKGGASEQT